MKTIPYAKAGGPPENWNEAEVYLDSVSLQNCVEANAEEGWAEVIRTFGGRPIIDMASDSFATERKYGKVLILVGGKPINARPL